MIPTDMKPHVIEDLALYRREKADDSGSLRIQANAVESQHRARGDKALQKMIELFSRPHPT
jgi:hypothetical protein